MDQKVNTLELSKSLLVSPDTVRRDINEMARKGLLTKVHGGAVFSIQKLYYYNDNVVKNSREKEIIGKKAANLVYDGLCILISDGTTNLALARSLPKELSATVITYCLPIAMELTEHPNVETIFLGGKVNKKSMVTQGLDVIEKLNRINADICFLGTGSIVADEGISEASYDIASIKKTMVANSRQVVSLVTSNKLGLRQTHVICKPDEISTMVTELDPDHPKLESFTKAGINLL